MPARNKSQEEPPRYTWGGARPGAGRKPGPNAGLRHEARPPIDGWTPAELTLKIAKEVPDLRTENCLSVVRRAFREGRAREGFRLVQYSVQADRIHLIVEASDKRALSSGIRGLSIRIARQLNGRLGREGRVFADRYRVRPLTTAEEVRSALVDVLLQARRRVANKRGGAAPAIDPCSSAPLFDGFTGGRKPTAGPWDDTVAPAETWLLKVGWKRYGKIDPSEVSAR